MLMVDDESGHDEENYEYCSHGVNISFRKTRKAVITILRRPKTKMKFFVAISEKRL